MFNSHNKLVVILGPTGSGKSKLALSLAKKYKGAIISADSRQIYRGMNIGTDKPSKKERSIVPHYLIDIINPDETYSVALYQKKVMSILNTLWAKNTLPFLVGGTGLYISSIVDGLIIPKVKPNSKLRNHLERKTTRQLYFFLRKIAPKTARTINKQNRRYLIRAIEIALTSKKEPVQMKKRQQCTFDILQIGLKIERNKLYQRINNRVDQMIKRRLISEVKRLNKKYSWTLPAMSGIGYRQIGKYLQDQISRNKAIELIKQDTRHYAKRQITWFKRDNRIHWIKTQAEAEKYIKDFI